MADYTNIKTRYQTSKKNKKPYVTDVGINRSEAFDDLMDSIREGYWSLPGDAVALSPTVETLIAHVTALKRDVEEKRTASGTTRKVVWRKLRPDHLAHSMLYLKMGIEIDTGSHHRVAIIGKEIGSSEETDPTEGPKEYWPKAENIAGIVPFLGEVPQQQAQLYFTLKNREELERDKLPMPLKYKLKRLTEDNDYDIIDVEWVLNRIASNGHERIPLHPDDEVQQQPPALVDRIRLF
jgi:hypothetical protein